MSSKATHLPNPLLPLDDWPITSFTMTSTMHRLAALLATAASLVLGSPAGDMSDFLHSINVPRAALPASLDGRPHAGCPSACSILTAGFPDRIVTANGNASIYTQEADAYW